MTEDISVDEALQFFIEHGGQPLRGSDREKYRKCIETFVRNSENGFSSQIIKTLAESVIFTDKYDINAKRKLLYCLVPDSRDFPYTIIPLAVSTINKSNGSPMMQYSVLIWFSGLLDYCIIDESHKLVHVCYTSLFGMLVNEKLCSIVCKILAKITRRTDVTYHRIQILMELKRKIGFTAPVSTLLRIYQVYRPDLVVVRMEHGVKYPPISKLLQVPLQNAKERIQAELEDLDIATDNEIWPEFKQAKKMNMFAYRSALPAPDVLVYADTLEEKKEHYISVLEYRRIKDMIRHIARWRDWKWPNSSACLLWKPAVIPLFRPNDIHVKLAVTNWLEIALRTEIIEQVGPRNKERQENLLDICIELAKHTDTSVPAIYHFMVEFLMSWDQLSFLPKVLELLKYIPFTSPVIFFEIVLEKFCHILSTAPIAMWCTIISALSDTTVNWALEAYQEFKKIKAGRWPLEALGVSSLEGIFFLTKRMERIFYAAVLRLGPHPLILNTIISYYNKVNFICLERLDLPLLVVVPPEFVLIIVVSGDLTAIHRMGHMLCGLRTDIEKLKNLEAEGDINVIKLASLHNVVAINLSVTLYLDSLCVSKGFSEEWVKVLSSYIQPSVLEEYQSLKNIHHFGSCSAAMPFSCLVVEDTQAMDFTMKKRMEIVKRMLMKLKDWNITGLSDCVNTFIIHHQPSLTG